MKKELKAAKRQKKQDLATRQQIKEMKDMVEHMKQSEDASTQATRIFESFNDRFDEVLAAINNTEKRLDFGSKNRTGRILNAIDELYNLLLDNDDRHDLHADIMNELRDLRKRLLSTVSIQPTSDPNNDRDEFYYVPNGRVPTSNQGTTPYDIPTDGIDQGEATDGQFTTDGLNTDASQKVTEAAEDDDIDKIGRKHRRRKTRTKQLIEIPQPVLIGPYASHGKKIVFIPEPFRRKKSRDQRLRYSLEITSRPEKIAKAHSESVLKTLHLI